MASRIAQAAGVAADDVRITVVAGSITVTVDILTKSATSASITGALQASFSSAAALSNLLGPSVTVEEIKEPPREITKVVLIGAYVPPAPPSLSPTSVVLYIVLPMVLVAFALLLLFLKFRGKIYFNRRMRRLLNAPTDEELRAIVKVEAAARGHVVRKRLDKGWRDELKKARGAAQMARWAAREREREEQAKRDKAAAEQAEADRVVAEKLAAERAAEQAILDQLAAERAAVDRALAAMAAARAEEERNAAAEVAALEEATAALHAFAAQAAAEKLERDKKEFWERGPTPDHKSLPAIIKSDPRTRNGVGDAREELMRLMSFVGMRSPKPDSNRGKVLSKRDPRGGFSPTIV